MIKIEKNVPFKSSRGRPKLVPDDTWGKMGVGDSVWVPVESKDYSEYHREYQRLAQHRTRAQYKMPGRVFTMRKESNGIRIWRTQ